MPFTFQYRHIRPINEDAAAKRERLEKYRRDVARATAMKALGVPPSAYSNYYHCEPCQIEWEEVWDNDDQETQCQNCNGLIAPYDCRDIYPDEDETPTNNGD